tara:strand:- start:138 stop:551 length:414 start_codon:yes stop_codon:yes gene_type:complete
MNETVSWDPSLVKKFSSSNHFKLLNQLRSEVTKYPLNNKRNLIENQNNTSVKDLKNKTNVDHYQHKKISKYSNKINENDTKQSTVSFNNSKNFSIYNQASDNTILRQNESISSDKTFSDDDSSSTTFKERLNQIDMK